MDQLVEGTMKYVTCFGGLWRLTNRRYRHLLLDIKARKEFNLDDYGKNLGIIEVDVTDLTSDEVETYL